MVKTRDISENSETVKWKWGVWRVREPNERGRMHERNKRAKRECKARGISTNFKTWETRKLSSKTVQ